MAQETYIPRLGQDADFADVTADSIEADAMTLNSVEAFPWRHIALSAVTFDGDGAANNRGDYDGTGNPTTLLTVTGDVLLYLFAKCTTDLAGASATIEVGVSGDTASVIAQTTATDIDEDEIWNGATPAAVAALSPIVVSGGADVIETIATANITAGVLEYHCYWMPISTDGNVVAA